jgi:hypothetical protein
MVLTKSDKAEINRMLSKVLMSFSERLTTGRQVKTAEEQALDRVLAALTPATSAAAPALAAPFIAPPRAVPLEEQALGFAVETAFVPSKRKKRMTKFNAAGMPKDPMTLDQENVLKIYKVKQTTVDGVVDFSDETLLAALCVKYQADVAVGQGTPHMIAEHEIFNQDIYITHEDVAAGNRPCNYYIELTQFELSEHEAAVATLKNLRNNQSSS